MARRVSGLKEAVIVSLRVTASGWTFHRWRWKTLSRGRRKQCPLLSREQRRYRNEQKLSKALSGYSGGTLPGKNTKEKDREEEEEEEDSRDRQVRNEIVT